MMFSNKMSSGNCSIEPIAIIISNSINNKTDFYLSYLMNLLKMRIMIKKF